MAESKVVTPTSSRLKHTETKKQPPRVPLFYRDNYRWMGIGAAVIVIGMLLMAGGKNDNPNQFDYKLVYSTTRVTIAPILILAGLMIEIYAIFKKPKVRQ
ncbi:MAG: DUF3098 domain-containing protein [Segetibacter sp.]|jgi:hypothetical protein|nr:DUF3098 domain-containing protein [Segetibacter sp.]